MAASFSFRAPIESTKDQKPRFDPGFEKLGSTPVLRFCDPGFGIVVTFLMVSTETRGLR